MTGIVRCSGVVKLVLFPEGAKRDIYRRTDNNEDADELRGREAENKAAVLVAAELFDNEAENRVKQ